MPSVSMSRVLGSTRPPRASLRRPSPFRIPFLQKARSSRKPNQVPKFPNSPANRLSMGGPPSKPPQGPKFVRTNSMNSPPRRKTFNQMHAMMTDIKRRYLEIISPLEWAIAISVAMMEQIDSLCKEAPPLSKKAKRDLVKVSVRKDIRGGIEKYVKKKVFEWIDTITKEETRFNSNTTKVLHSLVYEILVMNLTQKAFVRWGITQAISSKAMTAFLEKRGVSRESLLEIGACR